MKPCQEELSDKLTCKECNSPHFPHLQAITTVRIKGL